MSFKISIDKAKCIGCGSCVAICPEGFEMKNNKSKPKRKEIKEEDISCEKDAESACPVQAIKIEKQ